jgi:long-chain acyl-CoA synthetase
MIETLTQLFLRTVASYPKDDYMMYKKGGRYRSLSTAEFAKRVRQFSLGLAVLGHRPGDRLIILAESSPWWVMTDLANVCAGGVTVPIHSVLTSEQVQYIINDSEAGIVVFSNREIWKKLEAVRLRLPGVRDFVSFDEDAPEGVYSFDRVREMGERSDREDPGRFESVANAVRPGDLAAIIYTSGTTGVPKGAMLTHANFVSNTVSASTVIKISDKEVGFSFLPLSHTLERIGMLAYLYNGCSVAFAESMNTLLENLLEIRPHLMVSAPRIFEKIYAGIMNKVLSSSPLRKKIFFWALKVGKKHGAKKLGGQPISPFLRAKRNLAYRLVFEKIIGLTGGRIRLFLSGGAPLSKDIAEFFYAIGLLILEGYGLTETSPVISLNAIGHMKFGSVGKPIPGVEVRIAEDGEILTRGPHVMKGYYKMPAETAEVFDGKWFRTGDIGHIDGEGFLVITDRKKDIIVTSGGKNIAPQQIENLLKTSPYIASAVVTGDRRKFVSAIIVPNFEKIEEYAASRGIPTADRAGLVRNRDIVSFLLGEVGRTTVNLASYEKIKKIAVLEKDFEIDAGELTPTLKVKRNVIENKYRDLIDALYVETAGTDAG